ncbi:hypothetical protein, partial [Pseudoduganella aquatica]|uniref:hypothetical protein n=1 Tax=Pseudoduganella aquatica TaxID=2660641 RepID=UPI001CB6C06E
GGALVVAHGHDDSALLGCQMFVDSRHGGTLQQKVLHLVFENTQRTHAIEHTHANTQVERLRSGYSTALCRSALSQWDRCERAAMAT